MESVHFTSSKAYELLKSFAKKPFDLTLEGNLTPQRLSKYCAESAGYRILYGTERINDETMRALIELVQETNALTKCHKCSQERL